MSCALQHYFSSTFFVHSERDFLLKYFVSALSVSQTDSKPCLKLVDSFFIFRDILKLDFNQIHTLEYGINMPARLLIFKPFS